MIRQRFSSGRLARIGAWALAAITTLVAALNSQIASADDTGDFSPEGVPGAAQVGLARQVVPAAPADGLLIVRYQPTPLPPPPTIVRRVIVEERVSGSTAPAPAAAVSQSGTSRPAAGGGQSPAPAATSAPPLPPPAPAALPPPPPVQSSGS